MCSSEDSVDDVFLPKSNLDTYPINRDYYTPLDALDLKKTTQSWIALLYCESTQGHGTSYRFYMWRSPKGQSTWKVALCNFPADDSIMMPLNLQRILKFKQQARS
tara:strand:- start:884 stop:1198 length:315 start_codon:yes stop_codon:yes gene_type:complete